MDENDSVIYMCTQSVSPVWMEPVRLTFQGVGRYGRIALLRGLSLWTREGDPLKVDVCVSIACNFLVKGEPERWPPEDCWGHAFATALSLNVGYDFDLSE